MRKKGRDLSRTHAELTQKLGRPATDEEVSEALGESLQDYYALVDQLRSRGGVLSELTPVRSTLEDVFVDLVKADERTSVGAHE